MLSVAASMSASTGTAPQCTIVLSVATKVIGVVTTSSPGPTPSASSADVQARRRRGDRHGVAAADVVGERRGEALDLRPGRDPAGAQRVDELADLLFAEGRAGEGKERARACGGAEFTCTRRR